MRRPTRSAASTRKFAMLKTPSSVEDRRFDPPTSALSNDNTTPEGKEHAREQLKALGDKTFDYESKIPEEQHKDPAHVAAGLKAYVETVEKSLCVWHDVLIPSLLFSAISNPNNSIEAQAEAEKKLYDLEHGPQGRNLNNVAGGLKA